MDHIVEASKTGSGIWSVKRCPTTATDLAEGKCSSRKCFIWYGAKWECNFV